MKTVKALICMLLSFCVVSIGVGYAQVTRELTATGTVSFEHTNLYISNITNVSGVTYQGYSDTLISGLKADAGGTMTVTVNNPRDDTHYYLNYTIGDNHKVALTHPDGTEFKLGTAVASKGSVTFVVTFSDAVSDEHTLKFNFTLVPPVIDEPDPDPEDPDPEDPDPEDPVTPPSGGTNATAAIEFVVNNVELGLNSPNTSKTFSEWCNDGSNKSVRVLHCLSNNITGGNLSNLFGAIDANDILFTMEYVSSSQYNLYLYHSPQAAANIGNYITTYKQEIVFNSTDNLWVTGDSYKGYAKVINEKNGRPGVEHNNEVNVIWYANKNDLPGGATVVE